MAGGGVGLLDGLFLRLNLFAFAVPILCGDPSTVFPGCLAMLPARSCANSDEDYLFCRLFGFLRTAKGQTQFRVTR